MVRLYMPVVNMISFVYASLLTSIASFVFCALSILQLLVSTCGWKSFIVLLHERFLAGFFFAAVPWYVGAFILLFVGVDYREKAGLLACTIGASIDSSCWTYLINLSLCWSKNWFACWMCFYVFCMPLSFNVLLNCVLFSPNHWSSKMEITFYCYSVALFLGGYYLFQTLPFKLKFILFLKFLFPFIPFFLFFFSFNFFFHLLISPLYDTPKYINWSWRWANWFKLISMEHTQLTKVKNIVSKEHKRKFLKSDIYVILGFLYCDKFHQRNLFLKMA